MFRRNFVKSLLAVAASFLALPVGSACGADAPLDIGSRRELFVDDLLVDQLTGKAELRLHHPVPQEIALVHDAPWEGSGSGYHSIFQDGDLYRMYYKAWHLAVTTGQGQHRRASAVLLLCRERRRHPLAQAGTRAASSSTDRRPTTSSSSAARSGTCNSDAGRIRRSSKTKIRTLPADARYKAILRSAEDRMACWRSSRPTACIGRR